MGLPAGTRLGPYEIQTAVGAGGMGEVYKARDTRLDRIVAIKVLPESLATDPQFRERFDREARAISQIDHPHICTLHDVGEQDGTAFLVMQYLEGETLADRLTKGALPLDQALAIAIDIADALTAAHRAGIAHRDLKPGNVFLTKSGAKLLDFGLAKAYVPVVAAGPGGSMMPTAPPQLTAQGMILGTFQYMAPEQIEGHEADARTDIFAFGAVLYEMTTGRKAFEGKTPASLIAAILERQPTPISSLEPLAPQRLDRVVHRCLAKDPDARWQSAADLSIQLRWMAEPDARADDVQSLSQPSTRAQVRVWRWLSVALLVLGATGWGLTLFRPSRAAPAPSEPAIFSIAPPEGATLAPPAGLPNGMPWLAVSPDGRVLAFVAVAPDGRQQLWTRPLASPIAHPLADTDGAHAPFWSPDSRFIAFFARAKLRAVDTIGGKSQIVADAPGLYGSGTWNRENIIVFAPTPGGTEGLQSVHFGAGTARQFVTRADRAKGQRSHFAPQFLPDDRHFLFGVGADPGSGRDAETWIASLDGGEPRLLLRADSVARYAEPQYLLFRRGALFAQRVEGTDLRFVGEPVRVTDAAVGANAVVPFMALSTSRTGTMVYGAPATPATETHLVWRDRGGQSLGTLEITNAISAPSLSRDGSMMMVTRALQQAPSELWLYDVKRGTLLRFTFDSSGKRAPVWSPDGKSVAYSAGGGASIYLRTITGASAEESIVEAPGAFPSDWSTDGFVVFQASSSAEGQRTGWDLWSVSLKDRQPKPLIQTPFHEVQGALSPDGRWVAYASDESGAFEVYVQSFPGGGNKRIVSSGGGAEPRWRADGRELFYLSANRRLMTVSTTIGAEFDSAKPQALFDMNVPDLGFPFLKRYDVTPDGQRFIVQELTTVRSPSLTVIMNWPALLQK